MNDMSEHNSLEFDSTNSLKRCNSTPIIINHPTNKITVSSSGGTSTTTNAMNLTTNNPNITSTTSRSRDASPTPAFNIFAPRARRYSTGFSPLATNPGPLPRLTPRVSQLRQEECADVASREVNHEREIHNALQISQSWEDLTLDTEHWSFKSDTSSDLTNPLHVTLPTGIISCSSPSPTSSRAGLRLPPYGLSMSPSPTRRTFQTRRSMSPIAMRPSTLGPVKRKFELDDNYSSSYSPPPFKKIFTESNSRGHSPCRSPLLCPSPDSTEGRTTPKFYISKLCTANTNSSSSHSSSLSAAPSPNSSSAMEIPMDLPNLLSSKVANSVDVNSDLDCCSDVDFDCDSQNKLHADEKFTVQKRDEACEKLKKLFFTRVSTDSTETDCSFKSQPNDGSGSIIDESHQNITDDNIPDDNKSDSMECDSSKKLPSSSDGFCIVQNVVSSTVDIDGIVGVGSQGQQQQQQLQQQQEHCSLDDHKTVDDADVIAKCVPNDDDNDIVCGSVSVANVVIDTSLSIETESIENST